MSTVHSPKGLRISDEVHTALRVRAAQTGETMGEIAERALRKELGMMAVTWQVIEDNGGGLHLAVFEGDDVIYYGHGYEHNEEGLREDVEGLIDGEDPREGWEMPVDDPQGAYNNLTSHEHGWQIVADQDGVYHDRMGESARRVFGGNTAEWIANRFDNDGSRWELEDGTRLIDVLEAEAERQERRDAITIYRFRDGSAIVTAEEGWWDTLEGVQEAGLQVD